MQVAKNFVNVSYKTYNIPPIQLLTINIVISFADINYKSTGRKLANPAYWDNIIPNYG